MKTIQLDLTVDEVNLILEALGQQPFVKVSQLIGKLQEQATEQLNETESSTPESNEDH